MKPRGPRWLREAGIIVVWSAAAANVFVYTVKTVGQMYKRPPLSAWQSTGPNGGNSKGSSAKPSGKGGGRAKEVEKDATKEEVEKDATKVGEDALESGPGGLAFKILGKLLP